MEQRKRRIEILCIIALLVIMMPSADYLVKKAFADISITVVTPVGGALGATSDCTDVAKTIDYTWVNCNNVLYNLNSTYGVVDSLAVTMANSEKMLGAVSGNTVYIAHSGTIGKYSYTGTDLVQTGSFSDCTTGATINYDSAGFIWFICTTDRIVRLNPITMTATFNADLTDGAGIECGAPQKVHYSPLDNIGVVRCGTQTSIVTFKIVTSTSATLLDEEVGVIGTNDVFIYGFINSIIALDGSNVELWTYTAVTGLLTLVTTITTATDNCRSEVSDQANSFMICSDDVGTTTAIKGFETNSTGLFNIFNAIQSGFDANSSVGENYVSGTFSQWYVASSLNNQRIIVISGIRQSSVIPESPGGGEEDPTIIGGVNCSLPENENKLICRVTDPIGGSGAFVIGNGTSGLTGILCSIGIVDCTEDTNPRTNGLGLLIFVGSIFVVVAMFYLTIGKEAFVIPVYIWIIIILALSTFFTITGLIDPIFLILTVVGLIALAVPQIQKKFFGSGTTFGGGSSA